MLGLIKMITDGFKAVYIVNAQDVLLSMEQILKSRLPELAESQIVHYLHVAIMKGLEQSGLGQTNGLPYYASVGDRHWPAINAAANIVGGDLWRLFQQLSISEWIWIDRLKVVNKRELWFCWTK